ncbi:cell wall hydrolase [Rummeliibacillus stabekisii]|uniref:cell wall hydrolase n=1 Tax=Rummeliibacillus stabekisii TaxID=241244 RepID=UPI0037132656
MMRKLMAIPFALGLGLFGTATASAHTVKEGDTMGKIASEYGMSVDRLAALNPQVSNINLIYVGDEIATEGTAHGTQNGVVKNSTATQHHVAKAGTAEEQLLAQLVHAEAGSESFSGKVAVASVVLNRVESSKFPDSISGVIYQGGQFTPASTGAINNTPTESDYRAARAALAGTDTSGGALYFYNPSAAGGSWWDSMTTTAVIGGHVFKR